MLLRQPPDGYTASCATLRDTDLAARISAVTAPTRSIVGERDASLSPQLARETVDTIPSARFEVVSQAGHLSPLEWPGLFTALLATHFQGMEGAR